MSRYCSTLSYDVDTVTRTHRQWTVRHHDTVKLTPAAIYVSPSVCLSSVSDGLFAVHFTIQARTLTKLFTLTLFYSTAISNADEQMHLVPLYPYHATNLTFFNLPRPVATTTATA